MALHEVQLKGYNVRPGNLSLGTFGSYGIEQLHVTLDDTWSGLAVSMIIPMIWVIEIKFCAAPYCVQQEIYGVERTWELALLILGVLNI